MAISGQPVISRETRRLLITIVMAVTALWVLARIRFQERPGHVDACAERARATAAVVELRRSGAPDCGHPAGDRCGGVAVGWRRSPRFAFVRTPRSR